MLVLVTGRPLDSYTERPSYDYHNFLLNEHLDGMAVKNSMGEKTELSEKGIEFLASIFKPTFNKETGKIEFPTLHQVLKWLLEVDSFYKDKSRIVKYVKGLFKIA